jgi:type I restriction enzyme S subunit
MSFLEKLLEGVEVEWKPLGEMAQINRGRRVTKNELSNDKKYPVYSGGISPMGYFEKNNQDENTITVVKYGTAGFVNFITEKFWANDVCYCIKPSSFLNNKYLFYILKNKQNYIISLATDAIPAHLPTEAINGVLIPIPKLMEKCMSNIPAKQ